MTKTTEQQQQPLPRNEDELPPDFFAGVFSRAKEALDAQKEAPASGK